MLYSQGFNLQVINVRDYRALVSLKNHPNNQKMNSWGVEYQPRNTSRRLKLTYSFQLNVIRRQSLSILLSFFRKHRPDLGSTEPGMLIRIKLFPTFQLPFQT